MARAFIYEESYHLGREENYQRVGTRFVAEFTGKYRRSSAKVEQKSETEFVNLLINERSRGVLSVPKVPSSLSDVEWLEKPILKEDGKLIRLIMRSPLKLNF